MAKSTEARKRVRTQKQVQTLKPRAKRYTVPDADLRGHYVRVEPSGAKSFVCVTRNPNTGKQIWATIGAADLTTIDDARETARETLKRIKAGLPAFEEPLPQPDTFEAVAKNYLTRHVEAKGLRSQYEIERCLEKYIYPKLGARDFRSIRRNDIALLLDDVQDNHGDRQADYVLSIVRQIANWFAARDSDYISPIIRGMRRSNPTDRKRARIFDDDELRLIWKVADDNGVFGAIVKIALLTAQRRAKILSMRWGDITVDGQWNIPAEVREKGTPGALILPDIAIEIIRAQNRIGENPYVFAGRGEGHFNGMSKAKVAFDEKLAAMSPNGPIEHWTIHDLRRTGRSLMARAGVRPDIAERVLGHEIVGVEGVYDRHTYRDEMADALRRLAGLVEIILTPSSGNVVDLRENSMAAP